MHRFWRRLGRRLTGQDRVDESNESLRATNEAMDKERLERVKILEKNAVAAAGNFRAAKLYDAALVEREKADALAERRRKLETKRGATEEARIETIRRDYGMGGAKL